MGELVVGCIVQASKNYTTLGVIAPLQSLPFWIMTFRLHAPILVAYQAIVDLKKW